MIGLHYRNRRIGEFLKELDLVEGRNTGVPVIVRAMRDNGSPNPVFSSPETRDWLSVVLPIHAAFVGEEPGKTAGMSSVKSSVKSSVIITAEEELLDIGQRLRILTSKFSIRKSDSVIKRMAKILQEMKREDHISLEALARDFCLTRRTVDSDVAVLRKIKAVKNTGATRNAKWKVMV